MGDFNARVGRGEELPYAGKYGLGERNDRGSRLIEFCAKNNLVITNTWFKHLTPGNLLEINILVEHKLITLLLDRDTETK